MKVLLVDDDQDFAGSLCTLLEGSGFHTRTLPTGRDAVDVATSWAPDVVLLDVVLPDVDGLSVCHALRKVSSVGIIMMSALGGEGHRVAGLEVGADDFVVKPFSHRELSARVRAVHRRAAGPRPKSSTLTSGDLDLNLDSRRARRQQGPLDLTAKEFELLKTFMAHKGQALAREELYERIWNVTYPTDSRTLDAHVRSLREKIEVEPSRPERIVTLRGIGYRFEG